MILTGVLNHLFGNLGITEIIMVLQSPSPEVKEEDK